MYKYIKKLRPIVFENSRIPKLVGFFSPIEPWAVAFGPCVWCKGIISERTRRHETIHFFQQLEMLFIGQWILYGLSYLYNRVIKRMDGPTAYRANVFEVEAYSNDGDETYLETREAFAWLKYVRNKSDET